LEKTEAVFAAVYGTGNVSADPFHGRPKMRRECAAYVVPASLCRNFDFLKIERHDVLFRKSYRSPFLQIVPEKPAQSAGCPSVFNHPISAAANSIKAFATSTAFTDSDTVVSTSNPADAESRSLMSKVRIQFPLA
ncbi:hypothetical protein, partial [Sutterella massiliensis]|uniref:hypothetical protein n=1 Tax=Sutterella massiliensis TaxID=1816689 RepID=UPI001EF71384